MLGEKTKKKLNALQDLIEKHIKVAKGLIAANPDGFYAFDLLTMSAMHRSLLLIEGFRQMIDQENFICAAPLIRLQIDNNLRFFAASLVQNCDHFSMAVLKGENVYQMKDRNGKLMKDAYLVEKFSLLFPVFKKVYKETSGYVHLSNKHFFAAINMHPNDGTFSFQLLRHPKDSFVPEGIFDEAVEAFSDITDIFLWQIKGWSDQKKAERERAKKL